LGRIAACFSSSADTLRFSVSNFIWLEGKRSSSLQVSPDRLEQKHFFLKKAKIMLEAAVLFYRGLKVLACFYL